MRYCYVHDSVQAQNLYYRTGDQSRVCTALHRLAAKGLALTQANLIIELGYPPGFALLPGGRDAGKQTPSAPARRPESSASQRASRTVAAPGWVAPLPQASLPGAGKARRP